MRDTFELPRSIKDLYVKYDLASSYGSDFEAALAHLLLQAATSINDALVQIVSGGHLCDRLSMEDAIAILTDAQRLSDYILEAWDRSCKDNSLPREPAERRPKRSKPAEDGLTGSGTRRSLASLETLKQQNRSVVEFPPPKGTLKRDN